MSSSGFCPWKLFAVCNCYPLHSLNYSTGLKYTVPLLGLWSYGWELPLSWSRSRQVWFLHKRFHPQPLETVWYQLLRVEICVIIQKCVLQSVFSGKSKNCLFTNTFANSIRSKICVRWCEEKNARSFCISLLLESLFTLTYILWHSLSLSIRHAALLITFYANRWH